MINHGKENADNNVLKATILADKGPSHQALQLTHKMYSCRNA